MKPTLYILLLVTFLDFMGFGLVYPIFASAFFDPNMPFFSFDTSSQMRGFYLGLLYALMPLVQFFSAPVWGAISDHHGRKRPLQVSLMITFTGQLISVLGVFFANVPLLLLYRAVAGFGTGNISITQAAIADLSTNEEKAKNFGLYMMGIGAGFALGPFFGGILSASGIHIPFIIAAFLTLINLVLTVPYLKETNHHRSVKKLSWKVGLINLKKAFHYQNLKTLFLASFLCAFAWTYFLDFAPIFLIERFHFTAANVGVFYGCIGAAAGVSAGYLIRPFLSRFKAETLFWAGSLLTALSIFTVPFYTSAVFLIPFVLFFSYVSMFITPTSTALISNSVSPEIQGEVLGVLGSVNTAAYALSALLAGSFIGMSAAMSMWIGGGAYLLASLILLWLYQKKLFRRS